MWFLDAFLGGGPLANFNLADPQVNVPLVQRAGILHDDNLYNVPGQGVEVSAVIPNRGLRLLHAGGPDTLAPLNVALVQELGIGDIVFQTRPFYSYHALLSTCLQVHHSLQEHGHIPQDGRGDVRFLIALRPLLQNAHGGGLRWSVTPWIPWVNISMRSILEPVLQLLSSDDSFVIEMIRIKFRPPVLAGGISGGGEDQATASARLGLTDVHLRKEIKGWDKACLPLCIYGAVEQDYDLKTFTKNNNNKLHVQKGRRVGQLTHCSHKLLREAIEVDFKKIDNDAPTEAPRLWNPTSNTPVNRLYNLDDAKRIGKFLNVRIVVFTPSDTAEHNLEITTTPHVNRWLLLLEERENRKLGKLPEVSDLQNQEELAQLKRLGEEDWREKTVHLYYANNHYSICRKPQKLFFSKKKNRFCDVCEKPYASNAYHKCAKSCNLCQKPDDVCAGYDSENKNWPRCKTCKRDFFTDNCLQNHLKKNGECGSKHWFCRPHIIRRVYDRQLGRQVAEGVETGVFCFPPLEKTTKMIKMKFVDIHPSKHVHGEFGFCTVCKKSFDDRVRTPYSTDPSPHKCFMQVGKTPSEADPMTRKKIWFYDIETYQYNDGVTFDAKLEEEQQRTLEPTITPTNLKKAVNKARTSHEKNHNIHLVYQIGLTDQECSEYHTFNTVEAFLDFFICAPPSKDKKGVDRKHADGAILYAHNGSGYDSQCIRSAWHNIYWKPKYAGYGFKRLMSNTKVGSKLFSMALGPGNGRTAYDLDFKCTYLLIPAPLSAMPKMFKLDNPSLGKLDLPHAFAIFTPPTSTHLETLSNLPPDEKLHHFYNKRKKELKSSEGWMDQVMRYKGPIPGLQYFFTSTKTLESRTTFEKLWVKERLATSKYLGHLSEELRPKWYTTVDYYRPNKYYENREWCFKKEMLLYLEQDVLILAAAFTALQKCANDLQILDPRHAATLASWCMKVYREKFYTKDTIAIYPPKMSEMFRDYLYGGRTDTRCLYARVEGIDDNDWKEISFYAQDLPPVYNAERKAWEVLNPQLHWNRETCVELNNSLNNFVMEKQLTSQSSKTGKMDWGEELHLRIEQQENAAKFWNTYRLERISSLSKKRKSNIKYLDVTSLYPSVMVNGLYPVGHGEEFSFERIQEEKISQEHLLYLLQMDETLSVCHVEGHYTRALFHPVLPAKGSKESSIGRVFKSEEDYLADVAVDVKTESGYDADLETNEHKLIFTLEPGMFYTNSLELKEACDQGFVVDKVISMYHWKNTSRDLFKPYIRLVFKLKTQSSKWKSLLDNWYSSNLKPTKVVYNDEDKVAFSEAWTAHHGIDLEWKKVTFNPGMYSLAKFLLNTLWGKFNERTHGRSDIDILNQNLEKDLKTARRLLNSVKHELDFEIYNGLVFFYSKLADNHLTPTDTSRVSVPIGIFVTAQARLTLYKALKAYGDKVLYHDTDSVIIETGIDEAVHPEVELGCFLGQWTYETKVGESLLYLISGSPKNYCYTTSDGESVMKAKGINLKKGYGLKNAPGSIITHTTQEKLSREPSVRKEVKVSYTQLEKSYNGDIHTKLAEKTHRIVVSKNDVVTCNNGRVITYPIGFRKLLLESKNRLSLKRKRSQ